MWYNVWRYYVIENTVEIANLLTVEIEPGREQEFLELLKDEAAKMIKEELVLAGLQDALLGDASEPPKMNYWLGPLGNADTGDKIKMRYLASFLTPERNN